MKEKLPTFVVYIAIISFMLGVMALTQTILSSNKQSAQIPQVSINFKD